MTRVQEQDVAGSPALLALAGTHARFPARSVTAGWPVTRADREETLKRLTCAPFTSGSAGAQKGRALGWPHCSTGWKTSRVTAGRTGGWPAEPTAPAGAGGMSRRAGSLAAARTLMRGWGGCPRPC